MNRNVAKFGLSPNEEAQLIREECQRRRKLRIQQVRQQQRKIALQIRREVELRRGGELAQLEEELKGKWEQQQQEKLHTLQRLYHESLQLLGQGHRSAKENEPDLAARAQKEEENQVKAEERYREALKEVKSQRLKDHERQSRSISARKKALQAEKKRSAMVASLPPPLQNPIQNTDSTQPHVVKKSDVSAFATTRYHMPETTVNREVDINQTNAHVEAEMEQRKLEELKQKAEREREEQVEKARVRGKQALRKEQLVQDRECLLVELEHMQQTDMLRRRQRVSQMPPQVFQPYSKRQEVMEEFQRELEFAFEDMYTGERRVKGDVSLQLVPEHLPSASTSSPNQELDVSMEDFAAPATESVQNGTQQETGSSDLEQSVQAEPFRPRPRQTLKKLLARIRSQSNQWSSESTLVPEPEFEAISADEIPERDTTIDTGSLTNEERDVPPPVELPGPFHLAAASEAPEHLAVTDRPHPPDEFDSRIQEYEEERKKRDEELEREKQQQILLLHELEDQKAKLEQMLLEAQQQREHLKASVTHDGPVPEQEVSSVSLVVGHESAPPAGEDDHSRRIREYQQRLLEQDRIHQRSVEVARQRLEEYQKALQLRYNMMTTSSLPAVVPSDISHTPLICTECENLLPATLLPTSPAAPEYAHGARSKLLAPVKLPTREPAVAESPPDHSGRSLSTDSRFLSHEVDSVAESPDHHSPDVTARLTHDIMRKVTEHLSEELRPYSGSTDEMFHKSFPAQQSGSGVRLQPSYDAIQNAEYDDRQLPGQTVLTPVTVPSSSLQAGSICFTGEDMERQRHELQEVQRWVLEQKETMALQQRRKEEERRKLEMEQMKRQKEALQALISSDVQSASEAASKESVSLDCSQAHHEILASLLRAIEESNGGTLSHFKDDHEQDGASHQQPSTSDSTSWTHASVGLAQVSLVPSDVWMPKPPMTRIRMDMKKIMAQHELSVIQEVDTPVDTSLIPGLEDNVTMLPQTVDWDRLEEKESSMDSDGTVHTPCLSNRGQQTAESSASSSWTSARRSWRERALMGAGMSPESPESGLRMVSRLSSASGRGAESSGSAGCPIERVSGLSDPDWLSSTTISTGSYITTEPEHNSPHTATSPPLIRDVEDQKADRPDVSSPPGQRSFKKDGVSSGHPAPAMDSLFDNSTIQSIIDKYTKELTVSLDAIGTTTEGDSAYVVQPGSSLSQQALPQVLERGGEEEHSPEDFQSPRPATALYDPATTVEPLSGHFSDEVLSLSEDKNSFRPLIGHLADQSSCLPEEHRTSAMEQLVGQPSAHSSMIAQLPAQTVSVSMHQSGWDSALSRMIGRLSHQSSSHWLSSRQDVQPGRVGQMALEQSSTWLDEGHEENQMRPLLGEWDESVGQQSESLGEMTSMDLGASHPLLPAEVHLHSVSVPSASPRPHDQMVQNQITSTEQDSDRTEAFYSFHPLLAEVTHNETADPPMTFHLNEHEVPNSVRGLVQSLSALQNFSTHLETELETRADASVESVSSPEQLRAEERSVCPTASSAFHESFGQLVTSQCHAHESVLKATSTAQHVELAAGVLSTLTICDPVASIEMPEEAEAQRSSTSERLEDSTECRDLADLKSKRTSNLKNAAPLVEKILDTLSEKGILEQSEITLVSLTDTTLQDQDTSIAEEGTRQNQQVGVRDEGHACTEEEYLESTLLAEDIPVALKEDGDKLHPAFLEFQWGPSRDLQEVFLQRRSALIQQSSRRVDEIKAKQKLVQAEAQSGGAAEAGKRSKAKQIQHLTCKAKSKPQMKTSTLPKADKAGRFKQKKTQLHPPVTEVEVKLCTSEQRKQDVSEMHQRTKRLYEQLEEVKHQKEQRSRQEVYAKNRLKAKEFHKKTLQKLRAKQPHQ